MDITQAEFGKTPTGEVVDVFTLTNANGLALTRPEVVKPLDFAPQAEVGQAGRCGRGLAYRIHCPHSRSTV